MPGSKRKAGHVPTSVSPAKRRRGVDIVFKRLPFSNIESFCHSSSHKRVFVVCSELSNVFRCNRKLVVFDVDTLDHETFDLGNHECLRACIACHPKKPVVAISFLDLWMLYDWKMGTIKQTSYDSGSFPNFSFSQQGDLVFCNNDSEIMLLPDGAPEAKMVGRHDRLETVNICPSGEFIVSGGYDCRICVWSRTNFRWALFREFETDETVYFANFDARNRLMTQTYEQPLRLWDMEFQRFETGPATEIKKQMLSFCPDLDRFPSLNAEGIPEHCVQVDSWIRSMSKLNNHEVLFLDNYGRLFIVRKKISTENILAANFALAKCGLHKDVRDTVFRSLGVLDDTFCVRKFYA